ncbi:MAG: helix-turn-helix domain-containing protein [Gemmatimonadaceae bacterium]|jgi:transcriptional regulator with XRE-family HTH domain|nr:helix-turn-helix domain-containing protein [Gemmatimonadaceae bacterium]
MTPMQLSIVNLRALRDRAGLTQVELAERAGTSERAINHLENGKTRRVDLDLLDRVARVLKVEPGELLKRQRVPE